MSGILYVTGTPIGNLSDLSPRAVEIDTFSRGSVELIKVALPENSAIANKRIS